MELHILSISCSFIVFMIFFCSIFFSPSGPWHVLAAALLPLRGLVFHGMHFHELLLKILVFSCLSSQQEYFSYHRSYRCLSATSSALFTDVCCLSWSSVLSKFWGFRQLCTWIFSLLLSFWRGPFQGWAPVVGCGLPGAANITSLLCRYLKPLPEH